MVSLNDEYLGHRLQPIAPLLDHQQQGKELTVPNNTVPFRRGKKSTEEGTAVKLPVLGTPLRQDSVRLVSEASTSTTNCQAGSWWQRMSAVVTSTSRC